VKSANQPLTSVANWASGLVTSTSLSVPGERDPGVVAWMVVAFWTFSPVAAMPPTWTAAPATKFVPEIVTAVPESAGPDVGAIAVTVGAGGGSMTMMLPCMSVPCWMQ